MIREFLQYDAMKTINISNKNSQYLAEKKMIKTEKKNRIFHSNAILAIQSKYERIICSQIANQSEIMAKFHIFLFILNVAWLIFNSEKKAQQIFANCQQNASSAIHRLTAISSNKHCQPTSYLLVQVVHVKRSSPSIALA